MKVHQTFKGVPQGVSTIQRVPFLKGSCSAVGFCMKILYKNIPQGLFEWELLQGCMYGERGILKYSSDGETSPLKGSLSILWILSFLRETFLKTLYHRALHKTFKISRFFK